MIWNLNVPTCQIRQHNTESVSHHVRLSYLRIETWPKVCFYKLFVNSATRWVSNVAKSYQFFNYLYILKRIIEKLNWFWNDFVTWKNSSSGRIREKLIKYKLYLIWATSLSIRAKDWSEIKYTKLNSHKYFELEIILI